MGLIKSIQAFTRRIGLWLLAAGITLAVLFTAVLIYKLTVSEPAPPTVANCQSLQLISTPDNGGEIHVYQCQRGDDSAPWQGYEVWLYEPLLDDWTRLATAQLGECLTVSWQRDRELVMHHGHSRGDINLAESSVIYQPANMPANTISISAERTDTECPL